MLVESSYDARVLLTLQLDGLIYSFTFPLSQESRCQI